MKYRPEIDGLRALAVIPVILFHIGSGWMPGGYIGVDVFFVISGYLITSIIIQDYNKGTFTFRGFWGRRIRRILPVLISVVATTLIIGKIMLYGPEYTEMSKQASAALLSVANISHWLMAGNYWGANAENSALLHTWSLSVEEQFYLLFPVLMFVLLRYFRGALVWVVGALSLASLAVFCWGSQHYPSATFYLLPSRAWELGIGATLAIIETRYFINKNKWLSVAGVLAIVISYALLENMGPLIVVPVAGAAMIIACSGTGENIVTTALAFRPVVYVGRISYSLYLWHWPVIVIGNSWSLKSGVEPTSTIMILITFFLSVLSYHFIESTTRKNLKLTPWILCALAVGVGLSVSVAVMDNKEDTSMFSQTEWRGRMYNVIPVQRWSESENKRMEGIFAPVRSIKERAYATTGIEKKYGGDNIDIVVFGDSHALMWAPVLDKIAREMEKSIVFFTANGTPTFFNIPVGKSSRTQFFTADEKMAFDTARINIINFARPRLVVISARWSAVPGVNAARDLINYCVDMGAEVMLIEQPPVLFFGDRNAPQYLSYANFTPNGSRRYVPHRPSQKYQRGRNLIHDISRINNRCSVITIADIYLSGDGVCAVDGTHVLYTDDDHLSYFGALLAKDRIKNKIYSVFH